MLHKLQWRYATKKFDSERKLSEEQLTELLKAMNLSASSYGLQPYEFIVIKNDELQKKLSEAAFGQSQVSEASHLIVIAAKTEISNEYIDDYIKLISETRDKKREDLSAYGDMMKNVIGSKDSSEQLLWAQKQCYIALGTLLLACADQKIDACPMEGFEPQLYNEILGLNQKNLHATVLIPLGYRSVDDSYQHEKKVRRALGDIVQLRY